MRVHQPAILLMIAAVAILAMSELTISAQTDRDAEAQLQRALNKEFIDGDIEAAIKDYKDIASRASLTTAAKALLRLGPAYERLGNTTEAQKVYERIVREFSNQRETVAEANVRLLALNSKPRVPTLSNRVVWTVPQGPYFWGSVSRDGRFLAYGSNQDGDIYLHDFVTNSDRRITNTAKRAQPNSEGYGDDCYAFSRDGKQLAYSWRVGNREELRIVSLETPGIPQPHVVINDMDIKWINVFDWSPDGKWISAGIWRQGREDSQAVLISTETNAVRSLKFVADPSGNALGGMLFSPDGKFVTMHPRTKASERARDIVAFDLDAGREIPIIANGSTNSMRGWSPDGKQLVIESDRTGMTRLWTIAFEGGRPGETKPIMGAPACGDCTGISNDGSAYSPGGFGDTLGMTESGSLYYRISPAVLSEFKTVTIDFSAGRVVATPDSKFVAQFTGGAMSSDGKSVAYVSANRLSIVIRAIDTSQSREFKLGPGRTAIVGDPLWSPDGNLSGVYHRYWRGRPDGHTHRRTNTSCPGGRVSYRHRSAYVDSEWKSLVAEDPVYA